MKPWTTSASSPTPASKMPKPRFEHLNNSFKHKFTPHPTTSFQLLTRKKKISHWNQTYQHHQPTTNYTPPTAPNKRTAPATKITQQATKKPRTLQDMGIKARGAENTTTSAHTTTPRSASDVPRQTTITDLQDSIQNLPGTNTTRPFTTAAPHTIATKTVDAWIKKQPVPKQHQAALQEALSTLHQLMKEIPKAEQSTFADKAASLGLPVALAAKARNEELYKLLLFAVTQLEWLDRGDPDHVQFSAACVAFFEFLQILTTFSTWRFLWHCCLSNIPTCCSWFLFSSLVYQSGSSTIMSKMESEIWQNMFKVCSHVCTVATNVLSIQYCIYTSSCSCHIGTQHSSFQHRTLHRQYHTHATRPSEHQTTQAETIKTSTTCVMPVGTPLVLQPKQLSSICRIAVITHQHSITNTNTGKLHHPKVVSTTQLPVYFTTTSHKTTFNTTLTTSTTHHWFGKRTPALRSASTTTYVSTIFQF